VITGKLQGDYGNHLDIDKNSMVSLVQVLGARFCSQRNLEWNLGAIGRKLTSLRNLHRVIHKLNRLQIKQEKKQEISQLAHTESDIKQPIIDKKTCVM